MRYIIIFLLKLNLLIIVSPRQLFSDYFLRKFGNGKRHSMEIPPGYYKETSLSNDYYSKYVPKEDKQNFKSQEILFEGDIKLATKITRNALIGINKRWPGGKVPYEISSKYNERAKAIIYKAFRHYHTNTCVRFVPRTQSDKNYIHIFPGSKCSSYVGMVGKGEQIVNIDINGCVHFETVVHELMHALGFWHEQSRTDRDHFIKIQWENIPERSQHNFNKYTDKEIQFFGQPYDYSSIMHYASYDFSKNRKPTILTRHGAKIAEGKVLSAIDIRKINKMYCAK